MIIQIPVCAILEAPNSEELFSTYFNEGKTGLTGPNNVNKEIFYRLEDAGVLDCFGVFYNKELVGFIIASTSESPHYGVLVTTVMSIFVLKPFRRGGTAMKLIKSIEEKAVERGSTMVLLSSPVDGTLGKFAPKIGYKASNILYGKDLRCK